MPKLGDIVQLNMITANENEPCAGIVTSVSDDGAISATAFPVNGAPQAFVNVAPATDANEGFITYGTAPVAAEATTEAPAGEAEAPATGASTLP